MSQTSKIESVDCRTWGVLRTTPVEQLTEGQMIVELRRLRAFLNDEQPACKFSEEEFPGLTPLARSELCAEECGCTTAKERERAILKSVFRSTT